MVPSTTFHRTISIPELKTEVIKVDITFHELSLLAMVRC